MEQNLPSKSIKQDAVKWAASTMRADVDVDPKNVNFNTLPGSGKSQFAAHENLTTNATALTSLVNAVNSVLEHLTTFIATANSTILGASVIAVFAVLYTIFGRLGLFMIGGLAGIIWHIHHVSLHPTMSSDQIFRRATIPTVWAIDDDDTENPNDPFNKRTLSHSSTIISTSSIMDLTAKDSEFLDFSSFPPCMRSALNELTDSLIRDYVKWWYTPILPFEPLFPAACRQTLTAFILSVANHLSKKRPADIFLDFLTNSLSMIIVHFNELFSVITANPALPLPDALSIYIRNNRDCDLARLIDRETQNRKLKLMADDILHRFLDPAIYKCEILRLFFLEIIANLVLEKFITKCSSEEFINQLIIDLLDNEPSCPPVPVNCDDPPSQPKPSSPTPSISSTNHDLFHVTRSDSPHHSTHLPSPHPEQVVSRAQLAMDEAMKEAKRIENIVERPSTILPNASPDVITSTSTTNQPVSTTCDNESQPSLSSSPSSPPSSNDSSPIKYSKVGQILLRATVTIIDSRRNPDPDISSSILVLKSKPTNPYLIQIEPAIACQAGWIVTRKYSEFESLHEILRRLSIISGAEDFAVVHSTLPSWRDKSNPQLISALRSYLNHALTHQPLAESEGMKRFLEKGQSVSKVSPNSSKFAGIDWSGPSAVSKGMFDVLTKAPKEVAGSGKALMGVFSGNISTKKLPPRSNQSSLTSHSRTPSTVSTISPNPPRDCTNRESLDLSHDSTQLDYLTKLSDSPPNFVDNLNPSTADPSASDSSPKLTDSTDDSSKSEANAKEPLTEQESQIAVELIFAVITSFYSLSSAWMLRKSLLTAAKAFLLRPGSAQLESIRQLIQSAILDANSSDEGIAKHVRSIRFNTLPTPEEFKSWPAPPTEDEKKRMRERALHLLERRCIPGTLTNMMGVNATREAIHHVWQSLMIPEVARGLVFALLFQLVGTLTQ